MMGGEAGKKRGMKVVGNCPKTARTFFIVSYVQGAGARYVRDEAFGFCDECSTGMEDVASWKTGWFEGNVCRMQRAVASVTPCTEADAESSRAGGRHDALKGRIKAIMAQANTARLTPEEWSKLLRECVEEFVVQSVMGS